jgi:hypothetical protein
VVVVWWHALSARTLTTICVSNSWDLRIAWFRFMLHPLVQGSLAEVMTTTSHVKK